MLTGRELKEQGIITGDIPKVNIQQHGIDLNVVSIMKVLGSVEPGVIPNDAPDKEGKTRKTKLAYRIVEGIDHFGEQPCWKLGPGKYDIIFDQGCNIPPNFKMKIIHRSSLFRNGAEINSSLFDAGFITDKMGTMLRVDEPIIIECGARIAQAHVYASNEVLSEDLYNGQFQGDRQRA